jgi:hypothetical protein
MDCFSLCHKAKEQRTMCVSCGCGKLYDNHGDQRNITMQDLDQAAEAAGTTREQVSQNINQGCMTAASQPSQTTMTGRGDYYQSDLERESGRQPGEFSPQLGQESGSAYQEGLQMGETGRGGVQNPQTNP